MAQVSAGYGLEQINYRNAEHGLEGFGFLVARGEQMRTLGTVWNSALFPERAPRGMASFTSFLGGMTDPEIVSYTPDQIGAIALSELSSVLDISASPAAHHLARWQQALPQYNIGHESVVASLQEICARVPGVFLTGNYFAGPALGACVEHANEVARKAVRVGDTVVLHRAGDAIPEVVRVIVGKRPKGARPWTMPDVCPACGGPLEREEGEVVRRCLNALCPAQRRERLRHFASRAGTDIEGLGEAIIDQLIDRGYVEDPADLFTLSKDQLLTLEGFADRSADNLLSAIAERRRVALGRLINALGIRHVGEHTAFTLAARFGTLNALAAASEERLLETEGIGPVVAHHVAHWFASDQGRRLIEKLRDVGVEAEQAAGFGGPWSGQTWVLTGSLDSMSRPDAEARIRAVGGTPSASVSRKTNTVVAGPGAGSKLDKAQRLGVRVIDEATFVAELEQAETAVSAAR